MRYKITASTALVVLIGNLPYVEWLPFIVLVILAIFFIIAADSASVVMGMLTTQGVHNLPRWVVVFWGLVMSGLAIVMLLLGDAMALKRLRWLVIASAVPFALVLILAVVAWFRELRTDPMSLRQQYAESAVNNAVTEGVGRFRENFALKVVRAEDDNGAGAEVDSLNAAYTEWYQRTNVEGESVGYGFETGKWADGYDLVTREIAAINPCRSPRPRRSAAPRHSRTASRRRTAVMRLGDRFAGPPRRSAGAERQTEARVAERRVHRRGRARRGAIATAVRGMAHVGSSAQHRPVVIRAECAVRPLPDIAGGVVQAVGIRRKGGGRNGADRAGRAVGELAGEGVHSRHAFRFPHPAPGEGLLIETPRAANSHSVSEGRRASTQSA